MKTRQKTAMRLRLCIFYCISLLSFGTFQPATAREVNDLKEMIREASLNILGIQKNTGRKFSHVSVADSLQGNTAGRELTRLFEESLKKLGIQFQSNKINPESIHIDCRVSVSPDKGSNFAIVKLAVRLEVDGEELDDPNIESEFRYNFKAEDLTSLNDVLLVKQQNFELSKNGEQGNLKQIIATANQALLNPNQTPPHVEGTRLFASKGGDFSMEILSGPTADSLRPVPIQLEAGGEPRIELRTGDIYKIKVYNHLRDYELAVKVEIDGMNCLLLSDDPGKRERGIWLFKRGTGDIGSIVPGYLKNSEKNFQFKVGEVSETSTLLPQAKDNHFGVISARFFVARKTDEDKHPLEKRLGQTAGGQKTVPGDLVDGKVDEGHRVVVQIPLANLVIRYSDPIDLPAK